MRRIMTICSCFVVVLTLNIVIVANVSALEILASSATGTFKIIGGAGAFFGASEIKCGASTAVGKFENAHLGTVKTVFTTCGTNFLGEHVCTSTGAKAGEIILSGPFHVGLARKVSTEAASAAILLLLNPNVVYTCAGVGTVEVRGSIVGLLRNHANTAPLVAPEDLQGAQLVFKSAKSTKQEDKEFLLSLKPGEIENPLDTAKLEINLFGGGFSELGEELTQEATEVTPTGLHLVNG